VMKTTGNHPRYHAISLSICALSSNSSIGIIAS
jgi:hypothetical protein